MRGSQARLTACRQRQLSTTVHDRWMRKPSVSNVVLAGVVVSQLLQRYDIKQLTRLGLLHRDQLRYNGDCLRHYGVILGMVSPVEERRLRAVRPSDSA